MLDRPCTRRAPAKVAPGKEARSTERIPNNCALGRARALFFGFPPVPHFQRSDRIDPFCSHCLILTANSDGFFFGAHLKKLTAWTPGEELRLENLRNKELIGHLQALCHAIHRLATLPPSDQPGQ